MFFSLENYSPSQGPKFSLYAFPSFTVPPSIIGQVQLPENVSVVVKNPVALSCEASGIPLPAITWLKDGRPIKATSSVRILSGELLFDSVSLINVNYRAHKMQNCKIKLFLKIGSSCVV